MHLRGANVKLGKIEQDYEPCFKDLFINMLPLLSQRSPRGGGGGEGVLPNVGYIGMFCREGYGFKQFSLGSKKIIYYYLKMKIKSNPN